MSGFLLCVVQSLPFADEWNGSPGVGTWFCDSLLTSFDYGELMKTCKYLVFILRSPSGCQYLDLDQIQ